jgi:hypothetical protein
MHYDRPFEVLEKFSTITYRLRMPALHGIHPMLNIAHLEKYNDSPIEFGDCPRKHLDRADFSEVPEYKVKKIIKFRWKAARNGRRTEELLTKFVGYGPQFNEWLTQKHLKNTPEVVWQWDESQGRNQRLWK